MGDVIRAVLLYFCRIIALRDIREGGDHAKKPRIGAARHRREGLHLDDLPAEQSKGELFE